MSDQIPATNRATVTGEIIPPSRTVMPAASLADLTAEIQRAHGQVINSLAAGASQAIAAGDALLKAKALLRKQKGHGSWQDYVAVECRLSVRTAQLYMFLAKHKEKLAQLLAAKPQANAVLTQGEALRLLSSARKKRKARTAPVPPSKLAEPPPRRA